MENQNSENQNSENQGFDFKIFLEDSKAALLNPKEYFATMPVSGGFGEPVIKVLIYGVIIGLFAFIWAFAGLRFASGPSWLGGGIGIMVFIGSIIGSVIGLFIGGLVMLVISAIIGGNTDYETNARVVAALMVIGIVKGVFGFFDGINLYLSAIVGIAFSLWGLWMMYYALIHTLKAKEKSAKTLLIIFAVVVVIFSFTGIAAKKALEQFSEMANVENYENMSAKKQQETAIKLAEKVSGGIIKADEMKEALKEVETISKKMPNTTLVMETVNGITDKPGFDIVKTTINGLNADNNNFILLRGMTDHFIQAAINSSGTFVIRYIDDNGYQHITSSLQKKEVVLEMFNKYLQHDKSFKDLCKWKVMN